MARLFLLPLAALCLLLSSCIDGEEEVWIEEDGSGRIEATYRLPVQIMGQFGGTRRLTEKLREAVAKDGSLTLENLAATTEGPSVILTFALAFDDLRELAKFPKRHLREAGTPSEPVAEEALFGTISLQLSGLSMTLNREVDLSPILPANVQRNPALLGGSTFSYTFHLPVAASEHDAHKTSPDGRTLTWNFLLREHTTEPMHIWAEAPLPIPWWLWLGLFLAVALLVLIVVLVAQRTRAKRR